MLTSALSKPLQVASPDWASLYSASLELSILGPPVNGTNANTDWVLGLKQKFILFARGLQGSGGRGLGEMRNKTVPLTHQGGDFLVDKTAVALLVRNGVMVRDEAHQIA